jgi:putative membrane protein
MPRLHRTLPALAAGATLALGAGAAHAATSQTVSAADKLYLQTSIEGDRFEIAGGKLAQQQGSTAAVKAYGAQLVKDHTKSLKDATALARKLGIKVPKAPSPSMQWELQILGGLSGATFDQQYADLEAKDHQQDISEAQDEVVRQAGAARAARSPQDGTEARRQAGHRSDEVAAASRTGRHGAPASTARPGGLRCASPYRLPRRRTLPLTGGASP